MDWQPIHEVIVEHGWQEVSRIPSKSGSITVHRECRNCSKKGKVIELGSVDKRSIFDLPKEERQAQLDRFDEGIKSFERYFEVENRKILEVTGFDDISTFLTDIERRSQSMFNAGEIPYMYLREWAETSNKKARRKLLLLIKQGSVCNRCDRIVFSDDDLTVDHIRPKSEGGDLELTNLQLLCGRCNVEKSNGSPGDLDISPFNPKAQQCTHHVTCVELDELRRTFEAN